MFNIIFHRDADDSEESGVPTYSDTQIFRVETAKEVEECIIKCVKNQVQLELDYVTKYNRNYFWQTPYGEWGFLVLYNGYVYHIDSTFSEDYPSVHGDANDLPDNIAGAIRVEDIVKNEVQTMRRMWEHTKRFKKEEEKIYTSLSNDRIRLQVEKKEREKLAELLEKYPDMIKQ